MHSAAMRWLLRLLNVQAAAAGAAARGMLQLLCCCLVNFVLSVVVLPRLLARGQLRGVLRSSS